MDAREEEKRIAAEAAAREVLDGSWVGLGTGSTVAHFLPALARRGLRLTCVATSPATERAARDLGLTLAGVDAFDRLDLAVDGADQVAPDLWLVKGGGGAHTREKVVATAADRFLVIVSTDKLVERMHPPVPLEVLPFGLTATIRMLSALGPVRRRDSPPTPDGNVLIDFEGPVDHPAMLAAQFDAVAGVVSHGLFPPSMVSEVLVGRSGGVLDRLAGARRP
jgi:ribose 5-phosphate isomerase A